LKKRSVKIRKVIFQWIVFYFGLTLGNLLAETKGITAMDLFYLHPELKALRLQAKGKQADARHSDTYPDPKFGVAFRNYPFTGNFRPIDGKPDTPGMTGIEYSISQEIPYPGRLTREKEVRKWDAQETYFSFLKQTNRFFADLYAILIQIDSLEFRLELLESKEKLIDSLKKTSGAEYMSGKKDFQTSGKTHIERIRTKEQKVEWMGRRKALLSGLDYYVISGKVDIQQIKNLPYMNVLSQKEKNYKQKIDWNLESIPSIKESKANLSKAREEEKLGQITHYPDIEVFFAYMKRRRPFYMLGTGPVATASGNWEIMDYNEFRGDLFSFGATIRIPVWSLSKNKDLQKRNQLYKEASEQNQERLEKSIKAEIQSKIATWESIEERLKFMEKEHLSVLNKNLSSMGALYQTGKIGYTDLATMQLEILDLKLEIEEWKEKKQLLLISLMELTGDFDLEKETID
jgi:outer membrane protein, heavy metal efflux system